MYRNILYQQHNNILDDEELVHEEVEQEKEEEEEICSCVKLAEKKRHFTKRLLTDFLLITRMIWMIFTWCAKE